MKMNVLQEKADSTQKKVKIAVAKLKNTEKEIQAAEGLAEMKDAVKRFSPEMLGEGHAKGGTAAMRKRRFEVLDRLAKYGTGLSAEQKNDWDWFKHSWDQKMKAEHVKHWGSVFAGWMQGVVNQMKDGEGNAFSMFVYNETRRCFNENAILI